MSVSLRSRLRTDWLRDAIDAIQSLASDATIESADRLMTGLNRVAIKIGSPTNRMEQLILKGLLLEVSLPSRLLSTRLGEDAITTIVEAIRPGSGPSLSPRRAQLTLADHAKMLIEAEYARLTTIDAIARRLKCHGVHLQREFRKRHNIPIHRYLRTVRVAASRELIVNSDLKMDAIAAAVGFQTKQSFYRAVKEFTGYTPGHWRKRRRSKNVSS